MYIALLVAATFLAVGDLSFTIRLNAANKIPWPDTLHTILAVLQLYNLSQSDPQPVSHVFVGSWTIMTL